MIFPSFIYRRKAIIVGKVLNVIYMIVYVMTSGVEIGVVKVD
jgi:hypothetical protein